LNSNDDASLRPNDPKIQVLVHCYYSDRQTYLVSKLQTDDGSKNAKQPDDDADSLLASRRRRSSVVLSDPDHRVASELFLEVTRDQLVEAPAAKFYPVLESLMVRAERAAVATAQLLTSPATKRWVDATGQRIEQAAQQQWNDGSNNNNKLEQLEQALPIDEAAKGAQQVWTLLKDEDVTALLERCRQRLRQLQQPEYLSAATQQALARTGIHIDLQSGSSFTESVAKSRQVALSALEELLQQHNHAGLGDLEHLRGDLTKNFTTAFDSLSTAAKSDRDLNQLFESVAAQTTEWQEATGRLLSTRSASLFLEGASRLQARATAMFRRQAGEFQAIGEIGSKLTKSFTEGDAALARLKSIELGEAVKSRLVEAIEVRSESSGGLDGIIAGALAAVKGNGESGENQIRDLLKNLQRTASSKTKDAHETLLAVLSSQSIYREQALLRTEQALCDLLDKNSQMMGDDLTPGQIAAVVRGEGGTAKIFEPIAQRAMQQIEKQLDAAESQVQDATVLEVLSRVRKIMSGELTLTAVMDDIVSVLNDDKVVAAGESIVQQSEQVLDVIEGVSANKAVADAMQIVEKAGITKDSVMREFEKLNVDDLLGAAGDAVTDERARRKLLSSATDTALDFVLRVLPSMPVPPFEGVKDGLVYHISNLSMKGFRVKKEDIQIELAGIRATKRHSQAAAMPGVPTPDAQHEETEDSPTNVHRSISGNSSFDSTGSEFSVEEVHSHVKATELLIIDIRNISAVLDNALWSFEQTYLPYLKGNGAANVKLSGGAIRLQFELRKRRKEIPDDDAVEAEDESGVSEEWEPVLCLHDRSCAISEVDLTMEGGGKIAWIVNTLAGIFKGVLRDYVVATIVKVLSSRSGWILERLNMILAPYWDLILRTAQLKMVRIV